jgi:hypothetical protein
MFYGCTTLIKVTLRPVIPPVLGSNVFIGQTGMLTLVVPDEALDDYRAAEGWRDYFSLFKEESSDGDTSIDIDIEDEDSMKEEDADINL